jgi:putative flippase GtrA
VFRQRRLSDRRAEYFVFVAIGIGGLAVNESVLWLFTSVAGLHYTVSKAVAAAASFIFNFIVRKLTLFR